MEGIEITFLDEHWALIQEHARSAGVTAHDFIRLAVDERVRPFPASDQGETPGESTLRQIDHASQRTSFETDHID